MEFYLADKDTHDALVMIKNKDFIYEEYIRLKEMERMLKIANHPNQSRLDNFN